MRARLEMLVLMLVCACLLTTNGSAAEQAKKVEKSKAVAVITSPEDGNKVAQVDQVEGRVDPEKGWPVVLVKATNDRWWIQHPVKDLKDGGFATQAHFGNEDTPAGTKYRIVIIMAKSKKEAHEKFLVDTSLPTLPLANTHPRSAYVDVVRK